MKKLLFFLGLTPLILSVSPCLAGNVTVIRAEGVVNPVMAEFIGSNIDLVSGTGTSDSGYVGSGTGISGTGGSGEVLLVVELDTPGGLDTSMRAIVKKIISSPVPVAVYVSPGGARAASAGVFITLAAHVAAMAPGTNIGAAHPVDMSGKQMDETMAAKVTNDSAAYIRSLAEDRGRNADWAEKAVRESVSITETEALKKGVIDLVATSVDDLLKKINGKKVRMPSGTVTLALEGATITRHEMPLRLKILNVISNPNIAYLLMLAGILGLYIELTNPGTIFPGVTGAICLIISFYALHTLPVNYAGVLLIILALILFMLEIKVPSFGMLTVGGIVSLLVGSLMLFESPSPFLRVSLTLLIPTVAVVSTLFIMVTWFVVRAQRAVVITGSEGMVGLEGVAISDLTPSGQVSIHGEIWQASSDAPIMKGEEVVAVSVKGLKLKVRKKDQD